MHEYHCACDKCRWEYSVVGACTFFTKSETPESKSSTKSSNFEESETPESKSSTKSSNFEA
eukprot:scaffold19976_cov94-Skeletonema_marinoi.AAC.1